MLLPIICFHVSGFLLKLLVLILNFLCLVTHSGFFSADSAKCFTADAEVGGDVLLCSLLFDFGMVSE